MRGVFSSIDRSLAQPNPSARIRRGHPFAGNLIFAWIPQPGQLALDLASGLVGVYNGAVVNSVAPPPQGAGNPSNATLFTGTSSNTSAYVDFGQPAGLFLDIINNSNGNPATFAFRGYASALTGAFLGKSGDNVGSVGGWGIWVANKTGGFQQITFYSIHNSTNMYAQSTGFTTGAWIDFVVVYDGSLLAANQKFYFDGILQSTTAFQDGTGSYLTDAGTNLYLGRTGVVAAGGHQDGNLSGGMGYAYIWRDRALNPSEIQQLHADPFCFIEQPAKQIKWFGGSDLSNVFSDSLSLSDSISLETDFVLSELLSDSLSLSDSILTDLVGLIQFSLSDTLGLTDSVTTGIDYALQLNDLITLSDSIGSSGFLSALFSDSLSITDSIKYVGGELLELFDRLVLADLMLSNAPSSNTYNDSLSLSDSARLVVSLNYVFSDAIVLSDVPNPRLAEVIFLSVSDSLGLSDSVVVGASTSDNSYIRNYLNDVEGIRIPETITDPAPETPDPLNDYLRRYLNDVT